MTKTDIQELKINANTKVLMQNFEGALQDFNKALKADAKDPELYCNKGILEEKLHNIDTAKKDFDKAIQLNPKYAAPYYYRGMIKYEKYELNEALEDFTKAISLEPDCRKLIGRGSTYRQLGQFDKAMEDFTEAEKYDKESPELHYQRGVTLVSMGEKMAAKEDLQKAAEVGMEDANSFVIKNKLLF